MLNGRKKSSESAFSKRKVRGILFSSLAIALCLLIGVSASLSLVDVPTVSVSDNGVVESYIGSDSDTSVSVSDVPQDMDIVAEKLSESGDDFAKLQKYAAESNPNSQTLMGIRLTTEGKAEASSEPKTISVKGKLVDETKSAYNSFVSNMEKTDSSSAVIKAYQLGSDGEVTDLGEVDASQRESDSQYTFKGKTDGSVLFSVAAASDTGNFKVEYYGNITTPKTSSSGDIIVFNTDKGGNNQGGNLPVNGKANPKTYLTLTNTGITTTENQSGYNNGKLYEVQTQQELTQMYSDHRYGVVNYRKVGSVNLLADSDSYELDKVRVYASSSVTTYTEYDGNDDIEFTSIQSESNSTNKIYIGSDTVLRFLYKEKEAENKAQMPATFHDYDVSNGKVYTSSAHTSTINKDTWNVSTTSGYMYTKKQGINSENNYEKQYTKDPNTGNLTEVATSKYAFGNNNMGTGFGTETWNGKSLNKYYTDSPNTIDNFGCTFGLVNALDQDGNVVFSNGIAAPNLFGDGEATGKTTYDDAQLEFNKVGDTYTLSSVSSEASGISDANLEYLFHPNRNGMTSASSNSIWTNNFWAVDGATNSDNDFLFGAVADSIHRYFTGTNTANIPKNDDGTNHNSYFGMNYSIDFTISNDYVGPLNYLFFGDDDMWVFLDGQLICDIGGVHSSVGEYVNLWDYLEKPTGIADNESISKTHTLSFFYTERGAGGSCCYMRFTLPSVVAVRKSDNVGSLTVEKKVEDLGKEYLAEETTQAETEEKDNIDIGFDDIKPVQPTEPTEATIDPDSIPKTVYVNYSDVSNDNAVFYAWVWNDGEDGNWVEINSLNSRAGSLQLKKNQNVIFARMNPDSGVTLPAWNNDVNKDIVWNQTSDIRYDGTKNYYKLSFTDVEGDLTVEQSNMSADNDILAPGPLLSNYPIGIYKIKVASSNYIRAYDEYESGNLVKSLQTSGAASGNQYLYILAKAIKKDHAGNIWAKFDFWYLLANGDANAYIEDVWVKIANSDGTDIWTLDNTEVPVIGDYYTTSAHNTRKGANSFYPAEATGTSALVVGDVFSVSEIAACLDGKGTCWGYGSYEKNGTTKYGWASLSSTYNAARDGYANETFQSASNIQAEDPEAVAPRLSDYPVGIYKIDYSYGVTMYDSYQDGATYSSNGTIANGRYVYVREVKADSAGNIFGRVNNWYATSGGTATSVVKNAWIKLASSYDEKTFVTAYKTDGLPQAGTYKVTAGSTLNRRYGPGTTYNTISGGAVSKDQIITLTDFDCVPSDGKIWICSKYNTTDAWATSEYLQYTGEGGEVTEPDDDDITPVFSENGEMMGIDISKWQGGNINFNKVKSLGYEFVIIRAGYGQAYVDERFYENYVGAKLAGLKVGTYWYGYATTTAESEKEAAKYIDTVGNGLETYLADHGYTESIPFTFEMPLYYDMEETDMHTAMNKTQLTNMGIKFCDIMKEAGYYCGIYSGHSWFQYYLDISAIAAKYPVWEARYPSALASKSTYTNYSSTAFPKSKWVYDAAGMWQFTCDGDPVFCPSAGSSGLDVDVCYYDYTTYIANAGLNGFTVQEEPEEGEDTPPSGEDTPPVEPVQYDKTEFEFRITLYSDSRHTTLLSGSYPYSKYSADGTLYASSYIANDSTFTLKDGERIEFTGLPNNAFYVVTETANSKYDTKIYTKSFPIDATDTAITDAINENNWEDSLSHNGQIELENFDKIRFINYVAYKYRIVYNYRARLDMDGDVYYAVKGVFTPTEIADNLPQLSTGFIMGKAPYEDNFFNSISWDLDSITTDYDKETRTATANVNSVTDGISENLTVLDAELLGNGTNFAFKDTVTLTYGKLAQSKNLFRNPGTSEDWMFTTPDSISVNGKSYKFNYWEIYNCPLNADKGDVVFEADKGLYVNPSKQKSFVARVYSTNYNYIAYDDYYVVPVYVPEEDYVAITSSGADTTIKLLDYSRNQYTDKASNKDTNTDAQGAVTDKLFADFAIMYSYNGVLMNPEYLADGEEYKDGDITCGVFLEVCGELEKDVDGLITDLDHYTDQLDRGEKFVTSEADLDKLSRGIISLAKVKPSSAGYNSASYTASAGDKRNILSYVIDKSELDNKNRIEYYLGFLNTEAVRNRLLKAYSYVIYKNADGTERIDISAEPVVFLNYYDIGTKSYVLKSSEN